MSAIEHPSDQYNAVLPIGTTFIGIGGDASLIQSAHLKWDATLAATITVESSNFPDVALDSVAVGDWIDEPAVTDIIPATAAGGAMIHVANNGARRLRLRVVATAGGALRVREHGKQ